MSHCVSFITHFLLIYHLIRHAVLKGISEFSYDSLMRQSLTDLWMLLSRSAFPHVYKEAVLPRERTISSGFIFSLTIFSKILNSTVLITVSGFVINSHQSLDLSDTYQSVFILHHSLRSRKGLRGKKFSEKYVNITNVVLTLKELF